MLSESGMLVFKNGLAALKIMDSLFARHKHAELLVSLRNACAMVQLPARPSSSDAAPDEDDHDVVPPSAESLQANIEQHREDMVASHPGHAAGAGLVEQHASVGAVQPEIVEQQAPVGAVQPEFVEQQAQDVGDGGTILDYLEPLSTQKIIIGGEPASMQELEDMAAEDLDCSPDCEIEGPPRSRGRPKISAQSEHVARSRGVEHAPRKPEPGHSAVPLLCSSDAPLLRVCSPRIRGVQDQHEATRAFDSGECKAEPIPFEQIVRVLPLAAIKRCNTQKMKFQNRTPGLGEELIGVYIPCAGILSREALLFTTQWYETAAVCERADVAAPWLDEID
ncbi:hypothetical protein PybrP1_003049 [[Pythium] brassicae (nom. inval.)]|nr:hypothetical protein PybrP1_003049 [[Pythium] brassicae (nom. inval.)]